MNENKKWRCPYCDGLNDWQNEICEICGDGRREEAIHETKKTEEPVSAAATETATGKTVPLPERNPAPSSESKSATDSSPHRSSLRDDVHSSTETPPEKKHRVWIPILLILVVLAGGWFLLNGELSGIQSAKQTINGQGGSPTYKKMEKAPEIIRLTWNEEKKTVDITFKRNGLTGVFYENSHYGRIDDEK